MANAHEIMRTDFILADVNDTAAQLIGQMEKHGQREAVVMDGSTYKGMVSKNWLRSSRIDPAKMKINNLLTHRSKSKTPFFVPTLEPDTSVEEIVRLLATADVHALPVIIKENKKDKVVGVVRSLDVLVELRQSYAKVRANELASMKPITIDEEEEVGKALNIMNKQGIGRVIVLDRNGKLAGIISLTDILTDVHAFPRANVHISKAASHQSGKHTGFGMGEKTDILKLPVRNFLTNQPNCCTAKPTAPLQGIIDSMVAENVTSVVLIERDAPVGIIAVKDILEDYAKR